MQACYSESLTLVSCGFNSRFVFNLVNACVASTAIRVRTNGQHQLG